MVPMPIIVATQPFTSELSESEYENYHARAWNIKQRIISIESSGGDSDSHDYEE